MKNKTTRPILGIPEMDTQHDYLYTLFDRLTTELSHNEMAALLDEISGYLDFHITSEEHLIRHYKVPEFSLHQADHELAAQSFLSHMDAFEHGDMNPARLHNAMTGWLNEHSEFTDMKYAEFIKKIRKKQLKLTN